MMIEELQVALFVAAVALGGAICDLVHAKMIGEILVGAALGPYGANFVPFPDAVILIGKFGLMFLVFEGGLSVNLASMRKTGLRALAIAGSGTVVPVLLGFGFFLLLEYSYLQAIVGGVVLSSTSIAIAAILLKREKKQSTKLGALILNAAMLDDVFSLILLGILSSLSSFISDDTPSEGVDNTTIVLIPPLASPHSQVLNSTNTTTPLPPEAGTIAWTVIRPVLSSVGMLLLGIAMLFLLPKLERKVFPRQTRSRSNSSSPSKDKAASSRRPPRRCSRFDLFRIHKVVIVVAMLSLNILLAAFSQYIGTTHLLGCFAAGLSASRLHSSRELFSKWVEPLSNLLASVFFSSIGFLIPLSVFFDWSSFGWGLLYSLIAIVGKLFTGLLSYDWKNNALVVGWAMVGRGELGFVMSTDSLEKGLITNQIVAICCWALITATSLSPLCFHFFLRRAKSSDVVESSDNADVADVIDERVENADGGVLSESASSSISSESNSVSNVTSSKS